MHKNNENLVYMSSRSLYFIYQQFFTLITTYLHIPSPTHKLESETLRSGKPLIMKQVEQ